MKSAVLAAAGLIALAGSAPAQVIFSENFEGGGLGVYTEVDIFSTPTATLWHGEGFCDGITPIPATMGTNAAAYNQGDLALYNYSTGGANTGGIESPGIASPASGAATLAFEYTKQTEGGGSASFDQCFVEVNVGGGGYSTVGQVSGNSVCPASTSVTMGPAAIGAGGFTHRFRFDTVDGIGNAYQGWNVDNVVLTAVAAPPTYCVGPSAAAFSTISTSATAVLLWGPGNDDTTSAPIPLPAPFSFFGTPKATFQVNNNGWIAFDQGLGGGFFTNAPIPSATAPNDAVFGWWDDLHTGTLGNVYYDVTPGGQLIVEWNSEEQFPGNSSGENVTFQVRLNPSPANTIEVIYDGSTFSSGGPAATLWHGEALCDGITPIPASMGTNAASYNQGDIAVYNYNTGVANSGSIESPVIGAPGSLPVTLSFEYTKETEAGGSATFDQCFVESRTGAGAYVMDTQIAGNSVCASTLASVPLVGAGAGTWQHRFRFNTVDGIGNTYQGWTVDNVSAVDAGAAVLFTENFESVAPPGLASYTEAGGAAIAWAAAIGIENATGTAGTDGTGLGTANSTFPGTSLIFVPHGTGSFTPVPTGCGVVTLTPGGSPEIGGSVSMTLGGVTGIPVLWIGAPIAPAPLCPPASCSLGASLTILLPVGSFVAAIPCDPALIGGVLAVQGADVLGAGGCGVVPFGVPFSVSSTVVVTIG
ncbi:MAG: hypothetical protein L0323_21265 [Planctomycetes bacterium]|nr:hypothetical protein [Planctomycetota bacterium]